VLNGDRLECQVVSPAGKRLTLSGTTSDVEPEVDGSTLLLGNRALVHNAWAFAKFTYLKVSLPSEEEQEGAEKRAKSHHKVAVWVTDLCDDLAGVTKKGWCSSCFTDVEHERVKLPVGQLPAYLCKNCGSPTLTCADPRCHNMAVRGRGVIRVPRFCAEHRHEISGFEKSNDRMGALADYRDFLEYDEPNLSRTTKLAGASLAGLAVGAPAALFAAPAIGGAVGTLIGGYSGAAATSYGLALLGGGSLAAGGLGMAGGTIVVSALGGALGCALGASVTNAYVREDKSFHIEMLQGGQGVPVVVCNGFLSESGRGWGEWKEIVTRRYPDSPVYRVHWGAKELKDLGILAGYGSVKVAGPAALKNAALAANKAAAKWLGPLGPALLAAELAKNPWHVAKNRADKTGVVLADLLARTTADSYVLVGHSLGARVAVVTAQTLGTKADGPRVEAAHLTGAAIGAKSDWDTLTARVTDVVYNYHSTNDNVLKYLYGVAAGGRKAAGLIGFTPTPPKLENIDVSAQVQRHSDYFANITLK
jgi:pimeloyl-ACP methyl ester carboxylesterase